MELDKWTLSPGGHDVYIFFYCFLLSKVEGTCKATPFLLLEDALVEETNYIQLHIPDPISLQRYTKLLFSSKTLHALFETMLQ